MLFSLLNEGGICPDTWAAGVAPSRQSSTGSVTVSATFFHDATVSQSTFEDKQNQWQTPFSSEKTAVHTRAEAALWDLHRAHDELQARYEPAQDLTENVKPMTWERPEAQMWRRVVANAADHWQFRHKIAKTQADA